MSTKPFREILEGNVKLSAWRKAVAGTTRYSVTVERLYIDPDTKKWRSTKYLAASDLGALLLATVRLATTIGSLRANERSGHSAAN